MACRWSTIAAQLPGRTDNEIKNFWNTHLKKRLMKMGINPETYAPPNSSPLSSSSAAAAISSSSTSSFSAARHMAQWESARLEAEARLSRQSLLFSNSTCHTTKTTANQTATTNSDDQEEEGKKEPVDVFLRMWSSNIGETFRSSKVIKKEKREEEELFSPAVSSSCNTKQSSAVTVSEVNNDNVEDSTSDETFQFYLDLAAGDELSLFQNQNQHDHHHLCYSWFGNDLNEEAASDPLHDHNDPFK